MDQYLVNGRIFDGEAFHEDACLQISNDQIVGFIDEADGKGERIDLQGQILAPGFIDVQVNGGGGIMLNNDASVEAFETIADAHRTFGTTAMTPTLISDSWQVMEQTATGAKDAIKANIPGIRGVHFEGPYLNKARKGVHNEDIIRSVDPRALELLTSGGMGVVVTTMAPECVPMSYIRDLTLAGVKVCAGHTAGTYKDVSEAIANGLCGFTHLYNAMSPLTGREPGVVGSAIEDQDCWCGIIADGYHVHDASLRLAINAKPRGKIMLVTDAMSTVGAKVKQFDLYGQTIYAKDGRCATEDGTLAGSDLDMATAVRNTIHRLNQSMEEALRMASLYPATFLGLDNCIGRIKPGYEADLVLFDQDINVTATWIKGDMKRH